ncbi:MULTISPECIES: response regulator [unclassified Carboxylicivirga]|uniref:response regulator n=1 Tax=Carboxylicivirga TaxID=1628153 RepID=UPI003D32511E
MSHKVLVVDDSEVSLYLIKAIFNDDDRIEVLMENDSTRALETIKREKPKVCILDLMMPVIDGFQLLKAIKAELTLAQLPIVVITAKQDSLSFNRMKALGVQAYFTKPIEMQEVISCVKKLVDL